MPIGVQLAIRTISTPFSGSSAFLLMLPVSIGTVMPASFTNLAAATIIELASDEYVR